MASQKPVSDKCLTLEPPPLPPARAALARAIEALDAALRRRDQALRPIRGLDRVAAAAKAATLGALRDEVARLRKAFDAEVAGWVAAGAKGERPVPPAELIAAERRLGEIGVAGAEAENQLAIAREGYVGAAERAKAAEAARNLALGPAAVEAAEAVLDEMRTSVASVMRRDALLRSLVSALRDEGHRDPQHGHAALAAAEKIERAVGALRRTPASTQTMPHGRVFLSALRSDPRAELGPALLPSGLIEASRGLAPRPAARLRELQSSPG